MAQQDELKQISLVDSTHRIRWEVTKKEFDDCEFEDCIESPVHNIEIDGETSKWYLRLYPRGEDDKDEDYVNLFLGRGDVGNTKYNVRFQFGIQTPSGCFPYGDQVKKVYSKEKFDEDDILTFTCIEDENDEMSDTYGRELCTTEEFGRHFVQDKVIVVATIVIYGEGDGYRDHMEVVDDYVSDMRSASSLMSLSDFKIISGKQHFPCHKVLLASRSEYFRVLFQNEPTKKFLKVNESPDLVNAMLKFINKGVIPDNIDEEAMDLILMSDFYGLDLLTVACEKSQVNNLSPDNALEALITIDKINHVSKEEHRQKVLTYIKKEASKIVKKEDWKKFIQNYPDLITEIVLLNCCTKNINKASLCSDQA